MSQLALQPTAALWLLRMPLTWAALRVASLVDEAAIRLGSRAAPSSKEEKQLARLAGQHKEISSRILSAQEAADSLRAAARLHGHVEEFDSLSAAGESMHT